MSEINLRSERREYKGQELRRKHLDPEPLVLFTDWLDDAIDQSVGDATAMTVATADYSGVPSVRTILLKHYDNAGFCWYTDKRSPMGKNITRNPQAEILFFWRSLFRQVRIVGRIEELSEEDNNRYFNERPPFSRISAAASEQSSVVDDRATLESRVEQLQQQYPQGDVPRPEQWGGYRLIPDRYEFWQGRESRLHDRFQYSHVENHWQIDRLAP